VVRKLYDTLFDFLRQFLGRFENLSIGFVAEHLSFVESVWEMVEIGRGIGVMGMDGFVEREIEQLEEVRVFRYAPGEEGRRGGRKSIKIEDTCRQYKGW
jgi:hypothetical protein